MRKLIIVLCLLIPSIAFAGRFQPPLTEEGQAQKESTKSCVESLTVIDGEPSKPYSVISPLSAKANFFFTNSYDKLFPSLKKKACKLGADALIKYHCYQVSESDGHVYGNKKNVSGWGSSDSVAICDGVAIKWR